MLRCFLLCTLCLTLLVYADEDVLRPKGRLGILPTQPLGLVRNPWAFGIEIGGTLSFFSQAITQHQSPTYQTNLTSGSGFGPFINLAVDYALNDNIGIQARLGYDQRRFSLDGYYDWPCQTPPGSGIFIPQRVDQRGTQTINYWTAGTAIRIRFEENWLFIGGLSYFSLSNASFTATDTITEGTCQFYDEYGNPIGQRRDFSGSNTSRFSAARWSLDASIGYRVRLNEQLVLVPRVGAQLFLTPLGPDDATTGSHPVMGRIYSFTSRQLHAMQLAIGLWFNM